MNQQEALVKLSQVRLAINYVIRQRGLTKQAFVDPFDSQYYDPKTGIRNYRGYFSGAPYKRPVVTRIQGHDPGTSDTLRVEIPNKPNKPSKVYWINPASNERHLKDRSDIDMNSWSAAMLGGTIGTGAGLVAEGPFGMLPGYALGSVLGLGVGWPAAEIKHGLNESYRNNLIKSLQDHGYNPNTAFTPYAKQRTNVQKPGPHKNPRMIPPPLVPNKPK